jgi:hypothetical protein
LPSRQEELREAVQKFTRTRAATDICAVLNQGINASDPKLFIYPQQVPEARELWVYTQDVKTFEQVCLRKDLSHNKRDQTYVRLYRCLPVFVFLLASDWQITILRQLSNMDQLFIDGTFSIYPQGVTQMVSVLVKRSNWLEAIPVVHVLLKQKDTDAYMEMLNCILMLATDGRKNRCNLRELEICISVDFEKAMHNAIRDVLPKAKIIGCSFHLLQAVFRHIMQKVRCGSLIKDGMKNEINRKDLKTRIHSMINCTDKESFIKERLNFIAYYQMKQGYEKFVSYMTKTWLGTSEIEAKYPYSLWTKCSIPNNIGVHMTNNLIENFHKNINKKFENKSSLKRCIQLLQDIEEDYYTKKQQMENHVSLSIEDTQSTLPSQKRKKGTVSAANKRQKAIESQPALPQLPAPTLSQLVSPQLSLPSNNEVHAPVLNITQNQNYNTFPLFAQFPMVLSPFAFSMNCSFNNLNTASSSNSTLSSTSLGVSTPHGSPTAPAKPNSN